MYICFYNFFHDLKHHGLIYLYILDINLINIRIWRIKIILK